MNAAIALDVKRDIRTSLPFFRDKEPPFPESAAEHGWTALMLAANAGHAEVVAALLEAGADPHPSNPRGETALARAWTKVTARSRRSSALPERKSPARPSG